MAVEPFSESKPRGWEVTLLFGSFTALWMLATEVALQIFWPWAPLTESRGERVPVVVFLLLYGAFASLVWSRPRWAARVGALALLLGAFLEVAKQPLPADLHLAVYVALLIATPILGRAIVRRIL